MIYPN